MRLEPRNSLDPRVNRLPEQPDSGPKPELDQFGTYEVFVQPKEGKPFQHEGIVHAPNLEMAYILAKEAFTRRFVCVSLYVVDTRNVNVSVMTEGNVNVYDEMKEGDSEAGEKRRYEIYHLTKRGKQHVHAGSVEATGPFQAMVAARQQFNPGKMLCNVWTIKTDDIRFTQPAEAELWLTLPEKKFRDAGEYKGGEKLKLFLEGRTKQ